MLTQLHNRTEAGELLTKRLYKYANLPDVIIVALSPGGVTIGFEVAKALNAPLDICLVRKLSVPKHKELTMGAIALGGARVLDYDVLSWYGIPSKKIDEVAARELRELQRRNHAYRDNSLPLDVNNRTVILIDDGINTGSTVRAAIAILQQQKPSKIIVGVPVAPQKVCHELRNEVDELVCLFTPEPFYAIDTYYDNFAPVTDAEVHHFLEPNILSPVKT